MDFKRLIAQWADGDDSGIRALEADEIRALLDRLDPIQREGEAAIQAVAAQRRQAGPAGARLREAQEALVAEQELRAQFRRRLKRELSGRLPPIRESGRALARALVAILGETERLAADLEADDLSDEDLDDALETIDRVAGDLDGEIPGWRDLAG